MKKLLTLNLLSLLLLSSVATAADPNKNEVLLSLQKSADAQAMALEIEKQIKKNGADCQPNRCLRRIDRQAGKGQHCNHQRHNAVFALRAVAQHPPKWLNQD